MDACAAGHGAQAWQKLSLAPFPLSIPNRRPTWSASSPAGEAPNSARAAYREQTEAFSATASVSVQGMIEAEMADHQLVETDLSLVVDKRPTGRDPD